MPRHARVVVPGYLHHITQRGNRKMPVFFRDDDYRRYLDLLAKFADECHIDIWSYCLMPNHVHLIVKPQDENGLARAFAQIHKRYSMAINKREGWTGTLWQGRYYSYVMDEDHARAAIRYVEMNPVKAGLVKQAWHYQWSSASDRINGQNGGLLYSGSDVQAVMGDDWQAFLEQGTSESEEHNIAQNLISGLPAGDKVFVRSLEDLLNRPLRPLPMGRPKKKA